ncbi:MAG: sulfoxide reductase heme-binding subunit YedZ [Steroidobacteraceae bacterium]|nr:sulfoxide reductase heme-binding subunit YedZ [Steroidobacteraceae bacterium]
MPIRWRASTRAWICGGTSELSRRVALNVDKRYRYIYKPLVFIGCLTPIAWLFAGGFGVLGQSLGPDPIKFTLHTLGKTSLNLLILTLLVTPVRHLAGWPHIVRIRRMLGLFAFFYALLHFTVYLVLDQELDYASVLKDIAKRPYITVGFTALVILIPLAVTSTNRMMRRLGRRWQTLHRLVYVAAILSVWHYYWQVKRDVREPLVYAAILAVLLGYRYLRRARSRRAVATSRSGSATAPERI